MRTIMAACAATFVAASFLTGPCPAVSTADAADWTTWRADSARSGYTPDELHADLKLRWSYHPLHAPSPAWPRDDRMSFDRASHVVVSNGLACFANSVDGTVTALDAASGALKWSFNTGGPVRFAPVAWKDRLFVVSDDGYLYGLKLASGELIDRWRGGLQEDRVLGNTQMISKWPARGGPVIHDGLLYWGAGIWQSEGVFMRRAVCRRRVICWPMLIDCLCPPVAPSPQRFSGRPASSIITACRRTLAAETRRPCWP
jgi:outer membrane protein assembly factor BamB